MRTPLFQNPGSTTASYFRSLVLCRLAGRVLHMMQTLRQHSANRVTVADLFTKTAARYPNKIAIIFEDQRWTFKELDEYANKVGNHFRAVNVCDPCSILLTH